jgi:hypothetical protein
VMMIRTDLMITKLQGVPTVNLKEI